MSTPETHNQSLDTQAAAIESMLPRIARRLFTIAQNQAIYDLPVAQLRVCSILLNGASPITEIAEELGVSVSAATQIADRLEKAGLVERTSDLPDRRVKHLNLRPEGVKMMRDRREHRVNRVHAAIAELSDEERTAIIASLQVLLEASLELPSSRFNSKSGDPTLVR